jgi:EAL domain-containing protein (putative c-di-GMP-specific phosphodiesterase class I)
MLGDGPPTRPLQRDEVDAAVQPILRAVRRRLGVDVAFIGQIRDGVRILRHVDADAGLDFAPVGDGDPVDETYCHHMLEGRLPQYLPDARAHPLSARLPASGRWPIRTHLGVPIRFSDGRVYGTLCCFSRTVDPSLGADDLDALEMMAGLAAEYLEELDHAQREQRERQRVIEGVALGDDPMEVAFQPLRDLDTLQVVGVEALARFPASKEGPEWHFREAAAVGLGLELELRAVGLALDAFARIPAPVRLNLNVSPDTLYSAEFLDAVSGLPRDRLVVEVTEHSAIEDYAELKAASARLTAAGIWLAIDDVGMGFSGLNRILETRPDELKLDRSVIRGIDTDDVKSALVEAFCRFGERARLRILAEGIETPGELHVLRALGVRIGQGYHLGRPGPLQQAVAEHRTS